MSINVTVTGNPVSIKRGKMVTAADPHTGKKEFDKRRLLRLEQVRQQSKELAEDVRNKVRKEKKRQMGQIEKEGKENLKNWQNRKLLELHNQYLNALDEIGLAHKEAEQLQDESQIMEEQRLHNEELAKSRGRLAETKQQVQKNQENYKKSVPIQQKKLVRDIENTRAALVASMKPKEAKKTCQVKKTKPGADINISIPNDSDFSEASTATSDSSKSSSGARLQDQAQESEGFCECSDSSEGHGLSPIIEEDKSYRQDLPSTAKPVPQKSYRETIDEHKKNIDSFRNRRREAPLDTRISDRIKQRQLGASQPDYCDLIADPQVDDKPSVHRPVKDPLDLSSDECLCTKFHSSCPCAPTKSAAVQTDLGRGYKKSCKCAHKSTDVQTGRSFVPSNDIPSKPAVKLKDVGQMTSSKMEVASTSTAAAARVRHYDYPNRFERDLPSTSQVEKIQADSIEVIPDSNSEANWRDQMKQRDLDAQARGKRALEKEKIQKDYQELMRKLPVLQRKEHIARIGTDKPEFHMSEERLKERERERQNRLENAYSKAIPDLKPQIVTIPSRRHEIRTNNEPFEILDGDDSRTLNLGKWDTDTKPKTMFSTEEVQEIIKAFTVQKPEDRKAKLKQLLKSLKLQKEQLINEIRALPRDDSINALISDLSSFSDVDKNDLRPSKHKKRDKAERKRQREDSDTSGSATEPSQRHRTSSKDHYKKSPWKKKKKSPPKVLILQNMSTQTTPKPTKEKSSSTTLTTTSSASVQAPEEATKHLPEGIRICTKSHTPCDCYKDKESSEEVCKIFIKLNEEKTPKVEVVRPKQGIEDKDGGSTEKPQARSIVLGKKKPMIQTKSVATETEPKELKPSKVLDNSKRESWKEHFSKNSMSNSSTSYLSPPDFSRQNTTGSTEASKPSLYNLRSKPQQTNIIRPSPQQITDQNLLNYVQRLLSMSRNSIEDLGVSSSDVQTPSQSVIEIESNNPLAALHNMVKSINFRAADISKLNASTDDVRAPPNSSVNVSDQTDQESSCNDKAKELLLSQYADVTDSCAKRIANLAAMIEQLRQEKIEMLQSSPLIQQGSRCNSPHCSDKEYSTKYMEFPPFEERSKGTNSSGSMDEEELNRRLLDIDMSLAEKLKRFRQDKNDEEVADQEFLQRLQKLIQDGHDKEQPPAEAENLDVPFVPFLIDIQKLPILEPEPEGIQLRRYPPPSKGLINARKFNGDISLIPHELSTIIEADSQLSTKFSPNTSKTDRLRTVEEEPTKINKPPKKKSPEKFDKKLDSSESMTCTEATCPNLATSSSSSKLSSSSSSSSDLKNIEAMLKSIGMDWAIPTLHKTQEALALTSSSSSDNLSYKKKSIDKSTSLSEVSLKDFLKKQMISKISSSSLNRSDASPASFMRECSEISAIQATSSAEKAKQRTSTPVLTSKSTTKSQEEQQLFTGASDISSVKSTSGSGKSSGKPTFHSLGGDEVSPLI